DRRGATRRRSRQAVKRANARVGFRGMRSAILLAASALLSPAFAQTLPERLLAADWQRCTLGLGVELRRAWFANLTIVDAPALPPGPQSLTLLAVDLGESGTRLSLAIPDRLLPTTTQAN